MCDQTGIAMSPATKVSRVDVAGSRSAQFRLDVAVHVRMNEPPSRRGCEQAELGESFALICFQIKPEVSIRCSEVEDLRVGLIAEQV